MPTTLVSIAQGNVPAGPFSSVPSPGAVPIPADCETLDCSLPMPPADQTDTRNSITWSIYVSPDGVAGWVRLYGPDYWSGGTHPDHAGNAVPNSTEFEYRVAPQHRGQFLKAEGQVNRTQKVGVSVVSNP